ncbi:MAG: hypothetical protein K6E86_08000 [Bacteroidales bacterium]|nr:hypothetical protein [Bacteroidales bacterium]
MKESIFLKAFLALVLHLCYIGVFAQAPIDMAAKLGIKEDIEKLDSLVVRKLKKDNLLKDFDNLRQIHVIILRKRRNSRNLTKKDWMDYSFLDFLEPEYVKVREKKIGKKKKYLYALTFLFTLDGHRLEEYTTGLNYFNLCASDMPKDLLSLDKNDLIFTSSFDPNLYELNKREYVVIKDNVLYGFEDFSDCEKLIPWETYISSKYWE